jgi:hypothetical protein
MGCYQFTGAKGLGTKDSEYLGFKICNKYSTDSAVQVDSNLLTHCDCNSVETSGTRYRLVQIHGFIRGIETPKGGWD